MATQSTSAVSQELSLEFAPLYDENLEVNAGTLSFFQLCRALDRVIKQPKASAKLAILFNDKLAVHLGYQSPWPLLRLLMPQFDHHRGRYDMKEKQLAKLLSAVRNWDPSYNKAKALYNYTRPQLRRSNQEDEDFTAGDFASVAKYVMGTYCPKDPHPKVTLKWVNDTLDELARGRLEKHQKAVLTKFLSVLTRTELYWLLKILLGSMHLGMGHTTVLNHYHPGMNDLLDQNTDLRAVCTIVCQRGDQLLAANRHEVVLGQCFKPMLAARLQNQFQACSDRLKGKPFVMDIKLDGERMLVHKRGRNLTLFTRRATDYTEKYQRAHRYLRPPFVTVENCILDGEMCAWDTRTKRMVEFGENRTVAQEIREDTGRNLFFVVFDLLYLSDSDPLRIPALVDRVKLSLLQQPFPPLDDDVEVNGSITHLPLFFRRALLEECFRPEPHHIEMVKHEVVTESSPAQRKRAMETAFRRAYKREEEGLVVKNLLSPYLLGEKSKRAHHWMKLKPEYTASEHVDCLVLGAWFSEGQRRSGRLTRFLCFVRGASASTSVETQFYSFAKVASLKGREIAHIEDTCEGKWRDFDAAHLPRGWAPWRISKVDHRPDKVLDIEHGFVVQVSFTEIVASREWAADRSLRFPRCDCLRHDLGPEDVACLADLEMTLEEREKRRGVGSVARQKRKPMRKPPQASKIQVVPGSEVDRVAPTELKPEDERIFSGLEFCVMGSYDAAMIPDEGHDDVPDGSKRLQRLLQMYGGDVWANPIAQESVERSTIVIVPTGTKGTRKMRNLKKAKRHNMLYHSWVLRALREGNTPPVRFNECFATAGDLQTEFDRTYDRFGNSAADYSTVASLRACLPRVTEVAQPTVAFPDEELALLENVYGVDVTEGDGEGEQHLEHLPDETCDFGALLALDHEVTAEELANMLGIHNVSQELRAALAAVESMA